MKNSSEMAPEVGGGGGGGGGAESIKTNTSQYSNTLKPLINGFLTGQCHALFRYINCSIMVQSLYLKIHNKRLHELKINNAMILRQGLLFGATYTTASLGVFEILIEKLRNSNGGIPVSLYQEACCGLTSGAAAAFVWQPFKLASFRVGAAQQSTLGYTNLLINTLSQIVRNEGMLALWKGSSRFIGFEMARNMGMLASYHRSVNYLIETQELPRWTAQISASIVSGFFAAACIFPCLYFQVMKDVLEFEYRKGRKDVYRLIPGIIISSLSRFELYRGLFKASLQGSGFIVVQWMIFEKIKRADRGGRSE